jgi:hypothetical protein
MEFTPLQTLIIALFFRASVPLLIFGGVMYYYKKKVAKKK